jgi:protein TonB
MNSPINDISIEDRLREVYEKTDSREYAEALDVLELARAADPENIYISALKRQLDGLLSLSQADELSEDQRHDLMDPMQGIIECAIRDTHRQRRTGTSDLSASPLATPPEMSHTDAPETDSSAGTPPDAGDVQKELEALKLLYFQRASKFVMNGEYEQALAEVRRVFVVDPENTIAREYASRVEHLIQHARRLASEPLEPAEGAQETPQEEVQSDPEPAVEDSPHVHTERSTAWNEEFTAPRSAPIPEHRPAHPSSRQTVSYGDSLAVSLTASHDDESEYVPEHGRRKSKLFLLLGTVILTPLLAGVGVAIFSSRSSGTGDARAKQSLVQAQVQTPAQAQNIHSAPTAAATIGAGQVRAPEESTPAIKERLQVADPPPVTTVSRHAELKVNAETSAAKPEVIAQHPPAAVTKPEPVKISAPVTENAQPPQPKAPPAVEPSQQAPAPAFVAVQRDPQIVRLEKPQFPNFVWKLGIEGQVVVRVLIDANGKPLDSQILKSTNPVFEEPVVDAVMKSQFNPAQMGQGPVAAWLTIPFKFRQPK